MLNWAKLYNEGRCREIGYSWTEEEVKELAKGVSAEEIRIRYYPEKIEKLKKDIEKFEKKEETSIIKEEIVYSLEGKTNNELRQILVEKGVDYPYGANKTQLTNLILNK